MSIDSFAAQCRYLVSFATPMLEGLNDSHLALEPQAGNKTGGWLLGHLCITGDFGRRLCGREPICPKEWRSVFSPGTQPSSISASSYPRMADMCEAFLEIYSDLPKAMSAADPAGLDAQNPFEPARPAYPTVREFVAWLMTGHLAYHVAQLGDWRRASGLGHKGHI